MRVENVNQSKKVGYIKFNNDAEIDLISESLDRLIFKQERLAERIGDAEEQKKLDRFKESKERIIEIPKQNRMRLKDVKDKIKIRLKDQNENKKRNKPITPQQQEQKEEKDDDLEDDIEFKQVSKTIADSELGSGLGEGTEVSHRNMHVVVNALNDHIWEMEKDGLYKKTRRNQNKYDKLKQLLEIAQEQKAQFERRTPKPKGFGRLRK